ncbi:uncharacterized protein Z518_09753 [Rhinocladiella mackenziei CBS 650.93]|uniref:Rhinocladiella mackenziei CBS 650.93 unplaced genomic scaffold supercont1.8, whole genome shotgun sequence n=1 Tax=Rhinocladiella mackenziei CBS 650.93 TaxID=1442369 RepID=A0A0D2GQU8_9EURO|nr:uncharacterized protein Z518_09753 [Rhinocladiella mackenziei CBS 650.93]KIX00688.1 hypothetical protein Z518_09753 [Rhinocladiella mackenziei CBS 650.93]
MTYMGGLTFDPDDPSNFLKIPNLVAATRFGSAMLNRLGLYNSMTSALRNLARTGSPMDVLAGYCHMMRQHDVVGEAFSKKEEHHRDSIQWTILENPALKSAAEYKVTKVISLLLYNKSYGYVDLLITDGKKLYTVIEFKNIPIAYLGLSGEENLEKAQQLEAMKLIEILKPRFKGDNYRTGTIRSWVDGRGSGRNSGSVRRQLQSYITGPTVQKEITNKNFCAFTVVIIGSCQILVREMDRHGKWVDEFDLARWNGGILKK